MRLLGPLSRPSVVGRSTAPERIGRTMDTGTIAIRIRNLTVHLEPGAVASIDDLPSRSIALDGYVPGPVLDPANRRFSFDHHEGCTRLVTSATCRQVLDALCLGLDPSDFNVFVNDLDADIVLSVGLLAHPEWRLDAFVRRLVDVVAIADAHGPAYPSPDPGLLRLFAAATRAPVVAAQAAQLATSDELDRLMLSVVAAVEGFVTSGGRDAQSDGPTTTERPRAWRVTRAGTGWVMVHSPDGIFDLVYAAGHRRVVAYHSATPGSWAYTVGRQSDLVDHFPVGPGDQPGTILCALARREPGWGGGSTIGGAPRHRDGSRSRLSPDAVFDVIEEVVNGQRCWL